MDLSIKAGEIVGTIYDEILKHYHDPAAENTLKSLNMLCVRLVFCLYAEDAGIFGIKNQLDDYLARFESRDIRRALVDLFKVLDTPVKNRKSLYLDDDLAAFPYVNGGLFAETDIEIPQFDDTVKELLLTKASDDFNWSEISPTIFGAVFESTLNPETRRSGGMHYTSIENIHKVIDPLFLDDLKAELEEILSLKAVAVRNKKLLMFQNKLASLSFLDPACGSGNFLTETYLSLRRLENKCLEAINAGQIVLGFDDVIKVGIKQFYGIEINDFAVTVAKTALWIAESQMMSNRNRRHCPHGMDADCCRTVKIRLPLFFVLLSFLGKRLGWEKNWCGVHVFAQRGKSHCRFSLFYFLFSGKGWAGKRTGAEFMLLPNEAKATTAFLCFTFFSREKKVKK